MLNNTHVTINLPSATTCKCGGNLVPILRPVMLVDDSFDMYHSESRNMVKENINEVIWKCNDCGKQIEGEYNYIKEKKNNEK